MDKVFASIVDKREAPSRDDIARLLTSIAPPGKKQGLKRQVVERLYEATSARLSSPQGHSALDNLTSYEAY